MGVAERLAHACRRCCAVVPVGDVGPRDEREHRTQGIHGCRPAHAPHGLAQPLRVGEVVQGVRRRGGVDDGLKRRIVAIGEKDGARLAARRGDVVRAVLLVDRPCELVTADGARLVVIDGEGRNDARLRVTVSAEAVQVVAGLSVTNEGAVRHAVGEEVRRLLVDVWRMHVVRGVERGLGSVDREEGVRPSRHRLAGLLPGEDVIGQ